MYCAQYIGDTLMLSFYNWQSNDMLQAVGGACVTHHETNVSQLPVAPDTCNESDQSALNVGI